jgi:hypothetical protein
MHIEQELGDPDALQAYWGDFYIRVPYRRPRSKITLLHRRIATRLGLEAAYRFSIDDWYDPGANVYLDRFLSTHSIDAVMVEYVFMSRALLRVPDDVLKVIDTHDVFADRHRRYLANGMTPTWFSCSRRMEARGLRRADMVVAIQADEEAHFRKVTHTRVMTIGHPILLRPMPEADIVPGRILLVGSENAINVASMTWFVNQVLPLVQQFYPHVELAVAGTICRLLVPSPGLRLLGRLEDLGRAYATSQLVVNPMQFGTGLKIKSVEALGHARALVTTPCGAEGLEAGMGTAFRVAGEPAAFARELVALLTDPAAAAALGRAGHQFAAILNGNIRDSLAALFPDSA